MNDEDETVSLPFMSSHVGPSYSKTNEGFKSKKETKHWNSNTALLTFASIFLPPDDAALVAFGSETFALSFLCVRISL